MSISKARYLPLVKYNPAAPPLSLGYSIFELTCLPSALKSVDFTGFLLVFLCQRS